MATRDFRTPDRLPHNWKSASFFNRVAVLLLLFTTLSRADSLSLINGRSIDGKVSFDARDGLLVLPRNQPSQRIEISDLLRLKMDGREVKAANRRVTLVSGAVLAVDEVLSVNDREVRVKRPDATILTFSTVLLSMIEYRPPDPKQVPPATTFVGVQTVTGDLSEGELLGVDQREVKVSSVLFGIQSFETDRNVRAIYFRAAAGTKAAYVVRSVDGSVYQADSLKIDRGKLVMKTDLVGQIEISGDAVATIELGAASAEPVGEIPLIAPGEARQIPLGGKYRAALLTLGVPRRYMPTRAVRFVVSADGKEVLKTEPMTALDATRSVTLPVENVQTLTIRVDADGPAQLGTAGSVTEARLIRRG